MFIPQDAAIPLAKLTHYLLQWREQDDKSQFLARGGFTLSNPDALIAALRMLTANVEATEDRRDEWGVFYRVTGDLYGVNGTMLAVITIWMRPIDAEAFRFITLKPDRSKRS